MDESQPRAEDQPVPTVIAGQDKGSKLPGNKKLWSGGAMVLIVLILVVLSLAWRAHEHNKKPKVVAVCTATANTPILMRAAGAIYMNNVAKLQQAVTKIKQLSNYQTDPNCLYAVLSYSIDVGDAQSASQYFAELQKVYNPKQGFSSIIIAPKSIAMLKGDVAFIKQQAKELQQHTTTFNNPIHEN
jgi:hypothetical protein